MIIDGEWTFEPMEDIPRWFRTVHGKFYAESSWTYSPRTHVYSVDISIIEFVSDTDGLVYWYINFKYGILKKEYVSMYGSDFKFISAETAKDRVDTFLDKFLKLKAFF